MRILKTVSSLGLLVSCGMVYADPPTIGIEYCLPTGSHLVIAGAIVSVITPPHFKYCSPNGYGIDLKSNIYTQNTGENYGFTGQLKWGLQPGDNFRCYGGSNPAAFSEASFQNFISGSSVTYQLETGDTFSYAWLGFDRNARVTPPAPFSGTTYTYQTCSISNANLKSNNLKSSVCLDPAVPTIECCFAAPGQSCS